MDFVKLNITGNVKILKIHLRPYLATRHAKIIPQPLVSYPFVFNPIESVAASVKIFMEKAKAGK